MKETIPAVKIENLSFIYRNATERTLKNLDLVIQPGESVVIMGHNGAGKSSFCAILNGLIPKFLRGQMEGNVFILGENTRNHTTAELATRVGMVFQDFESQLFSTSAIHEVAFGCENLGIPRDEILKRIELALETTQSLPYRGCLLRDRS